ncbi:MAG TPA: ThuA domain-containing protein [Polyangia bacterium]
MKRSIKRSSGILRCSLAWLVLAGCSASPPCSDPDLDAGDAYGLAFDAGAAVPPHILLYTYSTGYRHASIPDGINAIRALGTANGFGVDVKGSEPNARGSYCANRPATADVAYFTVENLSKYAAVVFLSTTTATAPESTLMDDAGKVAFEAYIRAGGGFVGIHAAADAEYGWAFYHDLLGATFLAHGPPVTASLRIEDAVHPATSALPNPWSRFDEWYDFTQPPRPTAHVLINLDETTYPNNPDPMGDHPMAWCKTVGAGRSFYTGFGHTAEAFGDALIRRHLLGGILYAAGAIAADCSLPIAKGS